MKDLYLYLHRVEYVVGITLIAGVIGYLLYRSQERGRVWLRGFVPQGARDEIGSG
jgi:hypothetical protein